MSQNHEIRIQKLERKLLMLEKMLQGRQESHTETSIYEAVHKAWGKFSIFGPGGEIEKNLTREEALEKVKALNAGH